MSRATNALANIKLSIKEVSKLAPYLESEEPETVHVKAIFFAANALASDIRHYCKIEKIELHTPKIETNDK